MSEDDALDRDGLLPERRVGRARRTVRFLRRHHRGLGLLFVAAAGLVGGFAAGWELRDRQTEPTAAPIVVTVDRPIVAVDSGTDISVSSPNVLGLSPSEAQQALIDAGADQSNIEVIDVPSAGQPGLVVTQLPPPGSPALDTIQLGVSVPATMPDTVGKNVADAREQLDKLGAQVRVIRRYDPAQPEGTVLGATPAAGAPLTASVELVVASPPSSVYLGQLDLVEGSCSDQAQTVNGTEYSAGVVCQSRENSANDSVWLLNRKVNQFKAVVGQSDDSDPGSTVAWAVYGDGKLLTQGTSAYGQAAPIDVNVTGMLRLTVSVTLTSRPENAGSPALVFADPLLIGGPDEIESLFTEN